MTQTIATIEPDETVAFDHATLAAFCAVDGELAEARITRVLTEIEALIALVAQQRDHPDGLARSCHDLARLSGSIGMTTIRNAAAGVLDCLGRDDATGTAACRARLVRLGEPRRPGGWAMGRTPDTVA